MMNEKMLRGVISTCFIAVAFNDSQGGKYPLAVTLACAVLSAWLLFAVTDAAKPRENVFIAEVTALGVAGMLTLIIPLPMTQKIFISVSAAVAAAAITHAVELIIE
jgi:hypothetical protein